MSKYLVRNTTLEEKMVQNVIDNNDYNKMISMVRNIVDDNWALYLDMLIENAVKENNQEIIEYLIKNSGDPNRCIEEVFDCAINQGKLDLVKYAKKINKEVQLDDEYALLIVCQK